MKKQTETLQLSTDDYRVTDSNFKKPCKLVCTIYYSEREQEQARQMNLDKKFAKLMDLAKQ